MTRFARGENANKKKPHEASRWKDLKAPGSSTSRPGSGGVVKKKDMNRKTKYSYQKGEWKTQWKPKEEEEGGSDLIVRPTRPVEDPEPRGIAAQLEELKNSAELSSDDEREISREILKDQRREKRRLKRVENRQRDKICFNCRESGHDVASCPQLEGKESQVSAICFKCGSTEHSIKKCRAKVPAGKFPHATCFLCREKGHLSSQCPDNPRGLYPKGGCCRECGSVEHFQRDCPELQKKQGIQDIRLEMLHDGHRSADAEMITSAPTTVRKKGPKVVTF